MGILSVTTMTRTDNAILFLSEPPSRSAAGQQRLTAFDFAFLTTALIVVVGGCLFALNLGAARSTGHDAISFQWLADATAHLPVMMASLSKYVLLLMGSVLNSALIVLLVHGLRTLDRRVTTRRTRRSPLLPERRPGMENVRRSPATRQAPLADNSGFLLSPVFR